MSQIAFIRHGPTEWNVAGLIQGQSDIPLSDVGRAEVRGWRVPAAFAGFDWVTSPLLRARETARLLGAPACAVEPRLMEAHWGEWEGRNLKDLRRDLGEELARNEAYSLATGWDMKTNPPYHRGHGSAHLYGLAEDGALTVRSLDIDLRGDG